MDTDLTVRDDGFTLVELLVVIVVLGVLATVTVFAVRGITDKGEESGRVADERILTTAEEAHLALHNRYASEAELVAAELLNEESSQHDIVLVSGGDDYSIVLTGTGTPPPPEPPDPPGPPDPPVTVTPVSTTVAGFAGQSFGTGAHRIVVISDGSSMAAEWAAFTAAGVPLPTTEIVWLGAGDIRSSADVDAVVATGSTYVVAASSVPISSPAGSTFVGAYLNGKGLSDSVFWWGHDRGNFNQMLAYYTTSVVSGG